MRLSEFLPEAQMRAHWKYGQTCPTVAKLPEIHSLHKTIATSLKVMIILGFGLEERCWYFNKNFCNVCPTVA